MNATRPDRGRLLAPQPAGSARKPSQGGAMDRSLQDEQAYVDHCYALLASYVEHLDERIQATSNQLSTGTGQDDLEREAMMDNLTFNFVKHVPQTPACALVELMEITAGITSGALDCVMQLAILR